MFSELHCPCEKKAHLSSSIIYHIVRDVFVSYITFFARKCP